MAHRSPLLSLSISVNVSVPVSFFVLSILTFHLWLLLLHSWKMTLLVWTKPPARTLRYYSSGDGLKIDSSAESELLKTFLPSRPHVVCLFLNTSSRGERECTGKLARKSSSLSLIFQATVCVCELVWLFRSEFACRLRISSMGAFSRRAVCLRGLSR